MNTQEVFFQIMTSEDTMALATSVDNTPNVRVVNFGYDPNEKNTVYFTTFPGNQKIAEFESNDTVTIVILPNKLDLDGQVRIHGKVKKSNQKIADLKECLSKNAPEYENLLKEAGEVLIPYEIEFKDAEVTTGMEDPEILVI